MQPEQTEVAAKTDGRGRSEKSKANLKLFQKGVSGNPGGKSKLMGEIQTLARSKSKRAFERILELVESKDERVAMMAAKEVLDRAYGKPAATSEDDKDTKNVTINIVKLTDDRNHAAPQLEAKTVSVRTLALS